MNTKDNLLRFRRKMNNLKKSLVDTSLFSIHYVELHSKESNLKNHNATSDTFMYPDEITKDEAHKLISYLIKSDSEDGKITFESVSKTSKKLESAGFIRIPYCYNHSTELFIVEGDKELFKKSRYNDLYFDWYTEDYTIEEIESIKGKLHNHYIPFSKSLLR